MEKTDKGLTIENTLIASAMTIKYIAKHNIIQIGHQYSPFNWSEVQQIPLNDFFELIGYRECK